MTVQGTSIQLRVEGVRFFVPIGGVVVRLNRLTHISVKMEKVTKRTGIYGGHILSSHALQAPSSLSMITTDYC
jgi:hypothetical protein